MATGKKVRKINTGQRAIAAHDKAVQAITLRRMGLPLREIADRVGYANASGAAKAIDRVMRDTLAEGAEALRGIELETLNWMQTQLAPSVSRGDVRSVRTVLQIMVRRAKLLGLDAPTRVHHEGEVDVRRVAEDLARELNLPVDEVLAEAEQIVRQGQRR